jgi:hypothetical protein
MNALIMATIRSSAGRRRAAPPRARPYFTDADRARASDPFARLGLAWGATHTEIKDAYRRLARELHPDVSSLDPTVASGEFRLVREAYDVLTSKRGGGVGATADSLEEWSFRTWRSGDIIAQERTDVAGAARKRPVRPAAGSRGGGRSGWGVASLGPPDGGGAVAAGRRGEYLGGGGGDEGDRRRRGGSSTFGTGNSKWVARRKEFRPWTPAEGHVKGVGKYRGNAGRLYGLAQASEEEKQDSDGVQDTDYGLQDTDGLR